MVAVSFVTFIGQLLPLSHVHGRCVLSFIGQMQQENVLAGLLLDLSLLDQYMFKFRPGTLAAAALFLARVTAAYYSKVRSSRDEMR